ncbi:P-loop containing nucleoside triphosphate hydrolases superfamily protein, partial [Trifolium medium]|nr:P-loop containing nucleoside triphosphate hydrolases superfamily protein [Trifolium medium]MCI04776.1 P-loop containing nucleoside triphosphate hydrolases superfamily protein [Trifolium medium]
MLLRFPVPLHLLLRRHDHHQPLLLNSVPSKRFNSHIFSHPHSLFQTVPVLRVGYPTGLSSPSTFSEDESDVELGRLLSLLPEEMRRRVSEHPELQMLIEVVMDLGRKPLARFPSGDFVISEYPITVQDIQHATAQ